jgi:hypothetical protein
MIISGKLRIRTTHLDAFDVLETVCPVALAMAERRVRMSPRNGYLGRITMKRHGATLAGEMKMSNGSAHQEINSWFIQLDRRRTPNTNLVPAIEQRMAAESDPDKLRALRLFLAEELAFVGRLSEAETEYLRLHEELPDDPMPLIFLASTKLYNENHPESALPVINKAVEVAFRSGNFRRYALGVKARTALALKKYKVVEDVLERLLALKFVRGNLDCAAERDFFDRIPLGVIDEDIRRRFDQRFPPKPENERAD